MLLPAVPCNAIEIHYSLSCLTIHQEKRNVLLTEGIVTICTFSSNQEDHTLTEFIPFYPQNSNIVVFIFKVTCFVKIPLAIKLNNTVITKQNILLCISQTQRHKHEKSAGLHLTPSPKTSLILIFQYK